MARRPFVGGNWKMNLDAAGAKSLGASVSAASGAQDAVDVAVYPPLPFIDNVAPTLTSGKVMLGSQNFYYKPNGAYTGEVSLSMLADLGVKSVLVGHSERRHVLGETDALVNAKVLAALEAGLQVVLCVGESLEQREAGQTDAINMGQTLLGLAGVQADQMNHVVIAYEPVWAIGTGKTATADDAQAAHARIRQVLAEALYNDSLAASVRIIYGGSMKPGNAGELLAMPDIDGGLIGGAALKAEDFAAIIDAAAG